MVKSRLVARSDARRPIATREQRQFPLGWSSVEAAELASVPKRTVQDWRKTGFFVPALPAEVTGHPQGELYSLGDVVALRVMRMLISCGVEREVVARVGEELPGWFDEDDSWSFVRLRGVASAQGSWRHLWCMVPMSVALLEPVDDGFESVEDDGTLLRFFDADAVEQLVASDETIRMRDGIVVWCTPEHGDVALWFGLGDVAGEVIARADRWRRQRRIPPKRWPPWM
jgi:hypothetical protein